MRAYLDNNIIVSIENRDFSLQRIYNKVGSEITEFPYSAAHIQEADNIYNPSESMWEQLIAKRLATIKEISKKHYLFHDIKTNKVILKTEEPSTVLKTIREVPSAKPAIQAFANWITTEMKEKVRAELGIDAKRINNYAPEEVVEQLNKKLIGLGSGFSVTGLIEMAIDKHPNGKSFGLHNRIAGIFELLDLFGYWKDKDTDTSNVARLWDSDHTFFASKCNFFVSDDKRLRNKAKVVYNLYRILTQVMSSNGK